MVLSALAWIAFLEAFAFIGISTGVWIMVIIANIISAIVAIIQLRWLR